MKNLLRRRVIRVWGLALIGLGVGAGGLTEMAAGEAGSSGPISFVFTSDVHFGINRGSFRGVINAAARDVSAAMVESINRLPAARLPADNGLRAGEAVGPIDFMVITGDLTNRQERLPIKIQSAAASWRQFEATVIGGLTLKNRGGQPSPLLLVPGNHDVTNAIGMPGRLTPETDATSLAEIYNRMMSPAKPRTKDNYRFATDKIYYSRDFGGAHCIFLTIWPDSFARAWMENDLKHVPSTTPVFLFAHDPPKVDARHFTNPNGKHDVNATDKFENVLSEVYAGGTDAEGSTKIAQRALGKFLRAHRNIVAYFHGHSNWTEFYTWKGHDGEVALHSFRADSPMKGRNSGTDESLLSYQLVVYDVATGKLTARECRWNSAGASSSATTPVAWGESTTVAIRPR